MKIESLKEQSLEQSRAGVVPTVSLVIVNWNGAHHLDECLNSLRAQTLCDEMEVIVVENGSTDSSMEVLRQHEDFVRLIINPANVGFAAGCNQGITASQSEFIALLNNDTLVEPAWLEELVKAIRQSADLGWCTSKVLSYWTRGVFDNTGHVVCGDGLTRGRGRLELDRGQFEQVEEVFCASGCATLLRRRMLDDIGLFDEAFFAYCEDADLGFRARLRGWRCIYVPTAVVYHKFSASTQAFSAFKALHVERNRCWLAVKNLPLPLLLISPCFTLLRYAWQAYGAFTGRGASGQFVAQGSRLALVSLLLRAYWQALAGLPRVLRQRRAIQAGRKASISQVWGWLRQFGISAHRIALME